MCVEQVKNMCLKQSFILFILFATFISTSSQVLEGRLADADKLKYLVYIRVDCVNKISGNEVEITGGGLILNMRWILTAAHNFDQYVENSVEYSPYKILVVAGTKSKSDEGENAQRRHPGMKDVVVHEKYLPDKDRSYDAALVFLRNPLIESDTVKKADRFLRLGEVVPVGAKCVVAGWGTSQYEVVVKQGENPWDEELEFPESRPDRAMQGQVEVLPSEKCKPPHNSSQHLCYGCRSQRCPMTAKGDSGTPITCALDEGDSPLDGVVVAVHAFGCDDVRRKCTPGAPGSGLLIGAIRRWIDEWEGKEEITLKDRLGLKMKKAKKFFGTFLAAGATAGAAFYGGRRAYYNNL